MSSEPRRPCWLWPAVLRLGPDAGPERTAWSAALVVLEEEGAAVAEGECLQLVQRDFSQDDVLRIPGVAVLRVEQGRVGVDAPMCCALPGRVTEVSGAAEARPGEWAWLTAAGTGPVSAKAAANAIPPRRRILSHPLSELPIRQRPRAPAGKIGNVTQARPNGIHGPCRCQPRRLTAGAVFIFAGLPRLSPRRTAKSRQHAQIPSATSATTTTRGEQQRH